MSVTREKLYEQVWAEPMTTVAKRYEVSSNFLARVCERMSVPRPSRGYWAQRAVGIQLEQPPLPSPEPGADLEWVRDGSEPRRQPMAAKPPRAKQEKRERPDTHPLLVGAQAHFENARESRDQQYVRPYKRNVVDVFVSKEFLDTALKFANELFLALEDRGHRVILAPSSGRFAHVDAVVCEGRNEQYGYYSSPGRWSPGRPTIVVVGDASIGLTIFEVSEEVEVRYDSKLHKYVRIDASDATMTRKRRLPVPGYRDWTTKHWMPSGRLGLHAFASEHRVEWQRYWRESKSGELSGMFEAIGRELKRAVPAINALVEQSEREAEERQRQWEVQQREWARQEAERRLAELEVQRQKDIADIVSRRRTASDIRAYVAEVQTLVKDAGMELVKDGDSEKELNWALAYADRIDPLTPWREDVAKVKAQERGQPCPECGEVHARDEGADAQHVHGDEGTASAEPAGVAGADSALGTA